MRVRELRGTTISNVLVHPGGHRLIVHSRDNMLRSVDIATGAVIQIFKVSFVSSSYETLKKSCVNHKIKSIAKENGLESEAKHSLLENTVAYFFNRSIRHL